MQTVYGWHAVMHLLELRPELLTEIFLQKGRADARLQQVTELADAKRIKITKLAKHEIESRLDSDKHQGIFATCKQMPDYDFADLLGWLEDSTNPLLVILDGVQDPHNLGACLRSAAAFGALAVIIPKNNSAKLTPAAVKVSCGGALLTPVVTVTNISRALKDLKQQGVWTVGLAMDGDKDITKMDLSGPVAVVLGAEASGMRRLTKDNCDFVAHIPMVGPIESLNVSVSCGISLCYAAACR